MRRRRFNFLAIVSLLLLGVCVYGWITSSREFDGTRDVYVWSASGFDGDRQYNNAFIASEAGEVFFEWENLEYAQRPTTTPSNLYWAEDDVGVRGPALRGFGWVEPYGFQYSYEGAEGAHGEGSLLAFTVPYWSLALETSLLPLFWLSRKMWKRAKSRVRGFAPIMNPSNISPSPTA